MAGGATPQSPDSMTSLMQQERRKRRQTDRESLEQIRKRHLEVTAAGSDAVAAIVWGRGACTACSSAVPMRVNVWTGMRRQLL